MTPRIGKVAPKKRIRYDSIGEMNRKWKFDPLNTLVIQEEHDRIEAKE